jgi:hypothetical protein
MIVKKIKYIALLIAFIMTCGLAIPSQSYATPDGNAGPEPTLKETWVPSFMLMAKQLSAGMIQNTQILGTFFDAKHQLETQRLFQQKVAEAHKDYHPSEQMCEIGTLTWDLAQIQQRHQVARNAIQNAMFARALGTGDVKTMDNQGSGSDQLTRRNLYIEKFCKTSDNTGQNNLLCAEEDGEPVQQNADINFTQTIDYPLSLKFHMYNPEVTEYEENIYAFLDQIFLNETFPDVSRPKTVLHQFYKPYQEMRSLIAMRSVAMNSFAQIIGEKSRGLATGNRALPPMGALLREMGLSDPLIYDYIGVAPSYHAQMEILTKKIFQHPEFISNLYDKPANVKRIRTALSAIEVMQERDIHNAMQRREMLTSMILELQTRHKQKDLELKIQNVISDNAKKPKE